MARPNCVRGSSPAICSKRFQVAARNAADAHSPAPPRLDEIFSWEEERTVSNDWTARWGGQVFQIAREEEDLSLPGRKVMLRRRRNGQVEAIFKGRKLKIKLLPEGQPPRAPEVRRYGASRLSKPAAEHPWRTSGVAIGKEFWKQIREEGAKEKRARAQAAAASGQPPLRSGFPPAAAA